MFLSFYFFNSKTNKYFVNIYPSSKESRIYLLFVNTFFKVFLFQYSKMNLTYIIVQSFSKVHLQNIETIAEEVAKKQLNIFPRTKF